MKRFLVFLIICTLIVISTANTDLNGYLEEKYEYLKANSTQEGRSLNKRDSGTCKIENVRESAHPELDGYIKMLSVSNNTLVVTRNTIHELSDFTNVTTKQLTERTETTSPSSQKIFIKHIIFKDIGFTATKFGINGNTYIHQFTNNSYNWTQTISTPDASDANFFMNNNNLYLVVTNNKGEIPAESMIYKWLGFHFDEIQTVFTTGAIKVGSFTTLTAEIIVILQDISNRTLPAAVFEFKNEEIKKIQHIKTRRPINLDNYKSKNDNYLIIYSQNGNKIYEWKDFQFMLASEFQTEDVVHDSIIFEVNEESILAIPFINNLQIYHLIRGNVNLENQVQYPLNYTEIMDIHKGKSMYVIGLDSQEAVRITTVSMIFYSKDTEASHPVKQTLRKCFGYLEIKLDSVGEKLNDTKSKLHNSAHHKSEEMVAESLVNEPQIDIEIKKLKDRVADLTSNFTKYNFLDSDDLIINGNVIVKGVVKVRELTGNNINFKNMNGHRWIPEQWLRYEEPQTITGPSKIKTIIANHVESSPTDPLFKDLLLKNGDQTIKGSISITNLTTDKLYAKIINGIPMDDIYLKSKPAQIRGLKTFRYLNVEDGSMEVLDEESAETLLSSAITSVPNLDLDSNITVENLEVETINGVLWEKFKNSVFRINSTKEITGPLRLKKLETKHLNVEKIGEIDAKKLFTTSTDQVIEADMSFANIFAKQLEVETVNGVRIPEDVVLINQNATIEGTVKFDQMKIQGNLTLTGKGNETNRNLIVDTNRSDWLQIYSGKVTINGNLHVSNLKLLPNTNFSVSGNRVDPNLKDVYWTKNTHQKIPVHATFLRGVSAPHLLTEVLNKVKFNQYLFNNNDDKVETDFKFENVTVLGNVLLRSTGQHRPDLDKIMEEGVRTKGSYSISGKKIYLGTLRAENLQTISLEGVNVTQAFNKKWPQDITGTKIIERLIIKSNTNFNIENIERINEISLKDFLPKIIFINESTNISHLDFENITVSNLHVGEINGHKLEDYLSLYEKLKNCGTLNNLTVKGNVSLENIKNLTHLNDVPYKDLLDISPTLGKVGITEEVEFTGKINVTDFLAIHVNDVNLKDLTRRMLNLHLSQTVTAPFKFSNLKAANIITPKINNISVVNLIDTQKTTPQKLFFPNGTLISSSVMEYLTASRMSPCNVFNELADPQVQKWTEIEITGNVTLLDDDCMLYRVFEKSVKRTTKNVLHSEVHMAGHVMMKNVHSRGLINQIDFPSLLEDAVLTHSSEEQKITGKKYFTTFQTKSAYVLRNANATHVNGENMTAVNEDIVNKNDREVIRGKKTFFGGLQTRKFNARNKNVSAVIPENIVSLDHLRPIPEAIIDSFDVRGDLNIKFYDRTNFTDFLQKRLLISGPGTQVATGIYAFDYLEARNFTTSIINDLNVDDIVFDTGTQNISSRKIFTNPLAINGNITVDYINGVDIEEEFKNSIPSAESCEIYDNIIITTPTKSNGSIVAESINGFPVALIERILKSNSTRIETDEINRLKQQIIDRISRNIAFAQRIPTNFMYLEKSSALQITVPNAVSASSISTGHVVLMQVNGYESGAYCGLPSACMCPVRYTVEISPEHSVNMFPSKGFQRIFSYDNEFMIVNFMTNSVSTGAACRTDKSKLLNEVSMLTWNTKAQNNATGFFHQYDKFFTGYISKVDFFTVNGRTYAVIGRYYDPVIDTYELDCTVIKFSENKTRAAEIQKISTRGVQEVYVMQTAQGAVLVLGENIPSDVNHEKERTQIFRFDQEAEQFTLLRSVPSFGCFSATGIVQGSDSLIALAHKEAPVLVLKYYPEFDSYYLYQHFDLEDPVIGMSSFYIGDFGLSDAYLCLITSQEKYHIYRYKFLEGFKLKSSGRLEGLRNLVPFELNMQMYLFAPSAKQSSLLTVVRNGSG